MFLFSERYCVLNSQYTLCVSVLAILYKNDEALLFCFQIPDLLIS